MAGYDQAIDQRLVFGGEFVVESADIVIPLLLGAGTCDHRTHERRVEHPGNRELAGGDTLAFRVMPDLLREVEGFRPPFGLHHAAIVASRARVLVGHRARLDRIENEGSVGIGAGAAEATEFRIRQRTLILRIGEPARSELSSDRNNCRALSMLRASPSSLIQPSLEVALTPS